MLWWYWAIFGICLLGVEIFIPTGFYICFFGLGAIVTSILAGVNLVTDPGIQWFIFPFISIAMLVIFKCVFPTSRHDKDAVDQLENSIAIALSDILPSGMGEVELRGSRWTANNCGKTIIKKSDSCKVKKVEGVTLLVSE